MSGADETPREAAARRERDRFAQRRARKGSAEKLWMVFVCRHETPGSVERFLEHHAPGGVAVALDGELRVGPLAQPGGHLSSEATVAVGGALRRLDEAYGRARDLAALTLGRHEHWVEEDRFLGAVIASGANDSSQVGA